MQENVRNEKRTYKELIAFVRIFVLFCEAWGRSYKSFSSVVRLSYSWLIKSRIVNSFFRFMTPRHVEHGIWHGNSIEVTFKLRSLWLWKIGASMNCVEHHIGVIYKWVRDFCREETKRVIRTGELTLGRSFIIKQVVDWFGIVLMVFFWRPKLEIVKLIKHGKEEMKINIAWFSTLF